MDTLEKIKKYGRCCISDRPLKDSHHVNMVELGYKATWKFPVAGNVLTGTSGRAVAFIHDDYFQIGKNTGEIKYAVEFRGDEIIYHDVKTLEPID
jgi:hypothetical protein